MVPGPVAAWAWWGGLCALLAVAACLLPLTHQGRLDGPWRELLDWRPGLAGAEPWRWWTPVAVHYSLLHWGANLAGLLLVAGLGRAGQLPWRATLAWALAWPLTHLGLALRPDLPGYGGLSGVLHAGVAVAAVWLAGLRSGAPRWIGWALGIGLVSKVLGEAPWGPALQYREGWDIAIAPWAHATGTLAGLLCALPCAVLQRLSAWRRPTGTSCAPRP